jgi:hypothetical protein
VGQLDSEAESAAAARVPGVDADSRNLKPGPAGAAGRAFVLEYMPEQAGRAGTEPSGVELRLVLVRSGDLWT